MEFNAGVARVKRVIPGLGGDIGKEIRILGRKRQKEHLFYQDLIAKEKAKERPDLEAIRDLHGEMGAMLHQCYDITIAFLRTEKCRGDFDRLGLPLPDARNERLRENDMLNRPVLTRAGIHECG